MQKSGDVLNKMGWTSSDNQKLSKEISKKQLTQIVKNQLKYIDTALQIDMLSPPHWIGKYKVGLSFTGSLLEPAYFPSDSVCKIIRNSCVSYLGNVA